MSIPQITAINSPSAIRVQSLWRRAKECPFQSFIPEAYSEGYSSPSVAASKPPIIAVESQLAKALLRLLLVARFFRLQKMIKQRRAELTTTPAIIRTQCN